MYHLTVHTPASSSRIVTVAVLPVSTTAGSEEDKTRTNDSVSSGTVSSVMITVKQLVEGKFNTWLKMGSKSSTSVRKIRAISIILNQPLTVGGARITVDNEGDVPCKLDGRGGQLNETDIHRANKLIYRDRSAKPDLKRCKLHNRINCIDHSSRPTYWLNQLSSPRQYP